MRILRTILISLFTLAVTASCSVISQQVRSESEPTSVPFKTLIAQVDKYHGHTVILGGYILETRNLESETILKVLQVPFRFGEEPDTRDRSQGRFKVYYTGFLDPEVYKKDRVITVAGRIIGSAVETIGADQIKYLKIENREIYLWPDYDSQPPYYYPRTYPYYWERYPYYYRHPYWYW
jgi:outer membrane lipoprotein